MLLLDKKSAITEAGRWEQGAMREDGHGGKTSDWWSTTPVEGCMETGDDRTLWGALLRQCRFSDASWGSPCSRGSLS